jgi:malate synthase
MDSQARSTNGGRRALARAAIRFTPELCARLLEEEYAKLRRADNRDVYDNSKDTTLPIAREIVETIWVPARSCRGTSTLLNITLDNHDLAEARRRILGLVRRSSPTARA